MPPEPFPWDRRDFRKHERSGSDPRFGGGFGGGGPPRWRDQQHPNPPAPHPPAYHPQNHHQQQQQRWYSDFRPRLLPPVHGKQGGWHVYPDEAGNGFLPFGSRFNDRNLEDENFRSYGSGGDGRYFRNGRESRENRGSFSQKDWKASSFEPVATSSSHGRPNSEASDPRPLENTQTGHDSKGVNNNTKNKEPSHLPDSVKTLEKPQSLEKEQQDKNVGNADGLSSMGKSEKENCLGSSIDWKPLKWSRSGSLSSRGSSLSRTSSSKSMGVDSIETVAEVQQKKVLPVQSPTTNAAACVVTSAPVSSEETSSRKKPRLGWGEGLAKYEKKKVDGPEDSATKNGLVISVSSIEETLQSHAINQLDKSPRVAGLLDCASPATPSSVACSSSPGLEEKESIKAANVDHDAANLSCSPSTVSLTPYEGPTFNLENIELTSIASVSSLISELLQSDDPSSRGANYLGANSMNKLLLWRRDVLKALEMTESEIDSLETELKSLKSESSSCFPHPDASSSQPGEFCLKSCGEQVTASNFTFRPAPLQLVSSVDVVENMPVAAEDEHARLKAENIDSPGSATSKYVEVSPSGEDVYPSQTAEGFLNMDVSTSGNLDENYLDNGLSDEENTGRADCGRLALTNSSCDLARVSDMHYNMQHIYDSILASNKDSANGASEVLNELLPVKECPFDFPKGSNVSCLPRDPSVIRKNFLMRKRFLRFKEKVLTIKYKVFQHFWMEGRLVSVRKLRSKCHKKLDLTRHKKHRYGRPRISTLVGSSRMAHAEDVCEFVSGLLSESSFKPYRDALKMPTLILDKKEMQLSRFISNNGLVEDPCAVEKERSMINSWTLEEREIFIDKLATFGKDFRKISSFLDHKTTADCIEFYYKNHKSDCFEKARKKPDDMKQNKSQSTMYLVASGKRWNREAAAASLDMLGAASAIAANANDLMESQKCTSRFTFGASGAHKAPRCYDGPLQRSNSFDFYSNEREAVAADVLAGICGSLSSEAMSSCITSSVDPGDGYQDWRCQRVGFSTKHPLTPEVTQCVDDECSDESCGEMDPTDWTDAEKSMFIQAVSSYGKDFVMISQCVRTRSRDQCRLFFSKARKCLGLDLICPGLGIAVSGDVNGGGSDIEDASVVETGSVFGNEAGCKMDEDLLLPPSDMKLTSASDVISGTQHLDPESKRPEEYNVLVSLDPMDAEPIVKSSLVYNSLPDDTPVFEVTGQNGASGVFVSVLEHETVVSSSVAESSRRVEEAADCSLPNGSSDTENVSLVGVSLGHRGKKIEGPDLLLAENKSDNKKAEDRDVNSTLVSGINCTVGEIKSETHLAGNASRPSVDSHSSIKVDEVSGRQKKVSIERSSAEKAHVVSLHGDIASLRSSTLFSVPIKYQNLPNHNAVSAVGVNGVDDEHSQKIVRTDDCKRHTSGHSLLDLVESSQILRGYPVSVPSVNEEINGCLSCRKPVPLQSVCRPDGNLHSDHHTELFLQKCNNSRHHSKAIETPSPLQEQTVDNSRPQSSCSSDLEKPSGNGDVKLFGKILISSQQKPNSCGQQADDTNGQHHKSGCTSLNLKYCGEQKVNLDSAVSKFDYNNYLGSENIPVRSFSFWDGNRMQTGFPPVPDSTLLLTKYPTAFTNYARPAPKVEQPLSHGVLKSNDHSLNSVSVIPSRELCSSNGITDYLKNREVQPFTIDMKNPQDILFSEIQRRNGIDIVSGMQRQSRGMVGINVGRGGVLVGGQCSGVSDPVAAIKMHYAKAEQFSLQPGNIIKEDDAWRSKGDVGR